MFTDIVQEVLCELGYNADTASEQVTNRVNAYVDRGVSYICNVAGQVVDFESDLLARQLLIAYCRYANAQCENLFPEAYRGDLLELNCKYLGAVDNDSESE